MDRILRYAQISVTFRLDLLSNNQIMPAIRSQLVQRLSLYDYFRVRAPNNCNYNKLRIDYSLIVRQSLNTIFQIDALISD